MKSVKATIRKKVAKDLHEISIRKHDHVPMTNICKVLEDHGLIVLQEDGTEFEGFVCGAEGNAFLNLGSFGKSDDRGIYPELNNMLVLSWYRFEETGRYEVNAYIS